jgi:uncharacterized protein
MSDSSALLGLQRLDTTADQLRHRRANLPERAALSALETSLTELRTERANLVSRSAEITTEQVALEGEVETIEAKKAALGKQLARTSVPREADALTHEIDGLKARQDVHEERLLELMEESEPLAPRLEQLAANEDDLAQRAEVARAELQAAEAVVDAELADVVAARAGAVAAVAPALLERYERLRSRMGGIAVAELRDGHCTGCNLAIARSEADRLKTLPPDVLAECENCGRILAR